MAGLQIRLSRAYRSIERLDASSLPDFAVLIGRNGVGKTQLLEALVKGVATTSGIPREKVEMYDFASFAPGISATVTWEAVRFASSTADAYFVALPEGKSPNQLARDIYERCTDPLSLPARNEFDNGLSRLVRQMPDFSTFPTVKRSDGLAEYTRDIEQSVLGPMARAGGGHTRSSDHGCQGNPAVLVSLAMKLTGKAPHEISRADIMQASNYEGGTISNVISEVFTTYKVDAFLWAHKEWETSGGQYDALIARYEHENRPPWDRLRDVLESMRESAGDPTAFDFEFSDPARVTVSLSNFANFRFQTVMTNRTTGANYKLDTLSSGEKILMTLVLSSFNQLLGRRRPSLLLLDELDAMLHPSMVAALVDIMKVLFVEKETRVLMTSHSPVTIAMVNEDEIFRVTRTGGRVRVNPATRTDAVHDLSEGLATIDTGLRILAFDQAEVTILTEGKNVLHLKRWVQLNFPDDVRVFEGISGISSDSQLLTYGRFLSRAASNTQFLIVWDCDAADKCARLQNELTATSQVTGLSLTARENTIAPKGIENKYEEDLLKEFATPFRGADDNEKHRLAKKPLANHIYQNGKREDFRHFGDLHDAVSAILASQAARRRRDKTNGGRER